MSLAKKVFTAPTRLWMNWPLWGGLLVMLLLAKHAWVLFAPAERAVPPSATSAQTGQADALFGAVSKTEESASLNGIRPIGIFASKTAGFAVMQTDNGQVGVGLGGQVAPGIKLVETHNDYVVLERNGTQHRVELSKTNTSGITAAPITAKTPEAALAQPVKNMPRPRGGPAHTQREKMLEELTPEQRAVLQKPMEEMGRGLP